jgi:DNA replication protein DnaC
MPVKRQGPEVAGEQLAAEAARWQAGYKGWQATVRQRELELLRAERRVLAATGGLGVAKWRAACSRRRIATVQDARLRATALRARATVEQAMAERERSRAQGDEAVRMARLALAEASKRLALYGPLGAGLVGLSVEELRRLARRPARSPQGPRTSLAG